MKKIPAPLVVLLVAIPMGIYFEMSANEKVEIGSIFDTFKNGVFVADFSGMWIHTGVFLQYVNFFLLIGSIESLFTAKEI